MNIGSYMGRGSFLGPCIRPLGRGLWSQSSIGAAAYSASLTWAPHVALVPRSPTSSIARCVMKRVQRSRLPGVHHRPVGGQPGLRGDLGAARRAGAPGGAEALPAPRVRPLRSRVHELPGRRAALAAPLFLHACRRRPQRDDAARGCCPATGSIVTGLKPAPAAASSTTAGALVRGPSQPHAASAKRPDAASAPRWPRRWRLCRSACVPFAHLGHRSLAHPGMGHSLRRLPAERCALAHVIALDTTTSRPRRSG
jgi:hypothetical protein